MKYHSFESIEKSAELLDSILEGSTEYAIIATDLDDRIVLWNKGAELLYGYSADEVIGDYSPIDLHGKNMIKNNILFFKRNVEENSIFDFQVNAVRKDGSTVPVSITATPRVNSKGEELGFLIITRDITKAKMQERFRDSITEIAHLINLFKNLDEMCNEIIKLISTFLDIKVVFLCIFDEYNKSFKVTSHIGLNEMASSHGCSFLNDLHTNSSRCNSCFETFSQYVITSSSIENHKIRHYINPDLTLPCNSVVINIPLLSDMSLLGILHVIVPASQKSMYLEDTQILSLISNEISAGIQRKRLEQENQLYSENLEAMVQDRTEQLRQKDAQLVQSGKLATLGEMATGIAHEINQPLGSISLMTQGLLMAHKREKLTMDILELKLNSILEQIHRIDKIINHLRTFGRQSSETKEEVNINKPLLDVFELIGQQLKNHNTTIDIHLENHLPPILADSNRLEQVFLNLISNARDALEEQETKVHNLLQDQAPPEWAKNWFKQIYVSTYSKNGRVFASIKDNAGGIPHEVLNKIFEPFFTTKEVGKGTGLGLSISYGIIKEFNGEITVETEKDKGTEFILSFPSMLN